MKKKFLLVGLFIFCALLAIIFWQKEKILGVKTVSPIFAPDSIFSLTSGLDQAGIILDSPPTIYADTITASISGALVLFENNGNFATQIKTLQLVLSRLKMEGKTVKEIDLRFSKVIIR